MRRVSRRGLRWLPICPALQVAACSPLFLILLAWHLIGLTADADLQATTGFRTGGAKFSAPMVGAGQLAAVIAAAVSTAAGERRDNNSSCGTLGHRPRQLAAHPADPANTTNRGRTSLSQLASFGARQPPGDQHGMAVPAIRQVAVI